MADENKTALYLKIRQDAGMKFSPVDPLTNRVNNKVKEGGGVFLIFPEEPTEVDSKIAAVLLKQNGHLLSTEPYKEDEDVRVKTRKDAEKYKADLESKRTMETTEERAQSNARFVKVANTTAARIHQKVRPSHDPGLLYGGDRNVIDDKGEDQYKDDPMGFVETLAEFSEIDREKVSVLQLRHFAKQLKVKLGNIQSKNKVLAALDERSAKLTKQIQAIMERKNKALAADAIRIAEVESAIPKPEHGSGLLPKSTIEPEPEPGIEPGPEPVAEEEKEKEAEEVEALEPEPENPEK